ncbi:YaaA family protein [Aquipuribacter sp. SD81]|uniref:YaaA family protein n=1 Tax=Aquipuribacter sp. SD81 TaxID=3127703 RepID=UPI003016F85F
MLLLLPPSRGQSPAPRRARPVDLASLSLPGLGAAREHVLDALAAVCARPDAPAVLGLGPSLADEVARNTRLRTEPAADAVRVYSGVLFAAADLAGEREPMTATARRRARRHVLVASGLWGVVAPGDRIPAHRLGMGTDLPGTGPLAAFWRPHLARELAGRGDGLVVDCRSAEYQAAWRPGQGSDWVTVRVLQDGAVVSHSAKHARGLLAGHLVRRAGRVPTTPQGLVRAAAERFGAESVDLARTGRSWRLDVHLGGATG